MIYLFLDLLKMEELQNADFYFLVIFCNRRDFYFKHGYFFSVVLIFFIQGLLNVSTETKSY